MTEISLIVTLNKQFNSTQRLLIGGDYWSDPEWDIDDLHTKLPKTLLNNLVEKHPTLLLLAKEYSNLSLIFNFRKIWSIK